jgi:hypothetical protein
MEAAAAVVNMAMVERMDATLWRVISIYSCRIWNFDRRSRERPTSLFRDKPWCIPDQGFHSRAPESRKPRRYRNRAEHSRGIDAGQWMCVSSDLHQSPQIMEPVIASSSVRRHLRERPSSTLGIGIRSAFSKAVAHNQCGGNRGPEDAVTFVAVTVLIRQR